MAGVNPIPIPGRWKSGFALDKHTVSSTYMGDNEYGHAMYDTVRTDLGNLLYRLKYDSDLSVVSEIVDAAAGFARSWNPGVELIVPVPPSKNRSVQPVFILAEALGQRLGMQSMLNCATRVKEISELKNVYDYGTRVRLLQGAHAVDRAAVEGRRVLLFDDLFRSGATMNNVAASLYDEGRAADVFALTITCTRVNR
jgi:competence protein ComFC